MAIKALKALTAAGLLAATTAASAGTAPFNMVSGASNPGVDVSLTIQQSVVPGYDYDFVVSNSSLMGIVTGVYFEVDWNSMLGVGASSGSANLLSGSLSPAISGWTGTHESHHVGQKRVREWAGLRYRYYYVDDVASGIAEGASQVFSFNAAGFDLGDLESMLGTDGYGVAIKMQGLTEDALAAGYGEAGDIPQLLEVQTIETQIVEEVEENEDVKDVEVVSAPSPTAALAGLVVAGVAGLRRRRK